MEQEATVLVVDDIADIRTMIASRLEMAGYRVSTANEAWQGLVKAAGFKLLLLITDINMPGPANGVDGYRKLRLASPSLPVIIMTALSPEEAQKLVPTGDPKMRLIHKPIDFGVLRTIIKELTGIDREL